MPKLEERGRTPRELLNLAERKSRESGACAERALQLLAESERLNIQAKGLIVLSAIRERGTA